jgi:hypothetical protein
MSVDSRKETASEIITNIARNSGKIVRQMTIFELSSYPNKFIFFFWSVYPFVGRFSQRYENV